MKHLHEHGRIKDGHKKRATLAISKAKHNKQNGRCSDVPCTKIVEELDNPIRKVTDKCLDGQLLVRMCYDCFRLHKFSMQ